MHGGNISVGQVAHASLLIRFVMHWLVASFASRFPNKSAKDDWPGGAFGGREDGGGTETPETRACEANVSKNFSILNFGRMVLKGFLFCFNRIFVKEVVEVEKMK